MLTKLLNVLREHFGLTMGGAISLVFGLGYSAREWRYERDRLQDDLVSTRALLTELRAEPGRPAGWDLDRLLVTVDQARQLPQGASGFESFSDQRFYVKVPEPRWRHDQLTEGQLRRRILSPEALSVLGWKLDELFERTTAHVWTGQPVVVARLQPASPGSGPVRVSLAPNAGVQRISHETLRELWQSSWDAAGGGLPTHVAMSMMTQEVIEGLWISSRFKDLAFHVDHVRSAGDLVYMASRYQCPNVEVEGRPGRHLVRWYSESVFVDRGGDGLWIWVSSPSVDDSRGYGDGWLREWLLNVRVEVRG